MRSKLIKLASQSGLFEKVADSRWRALVRAGKLSEESLAGLKGMGLLHTPEAVAKETAGLQRGTNALHKEYGVQHTDTTDLGGAKTHIYDPTGGDKLTAAQSAFQRIRGHDGIRGMYQRAKSALASGKTAFTAIANPMLGETKTLTVAPGAGTLALLGDLRNSGKSATNAGAEALINRHEMDEARAVNRLVMKHPSARAQSVMRGQMWSSHLTPKVVMEESGHVNFLPPELKRNMADMRTASGEQAAMNRAAGYNMPYGQWYRKKGYAQNRLEQAARENPPKPLRSLDEFKALGRAFKRPAGHFVEEANNNVAKIIPQRFGLFAPKNHVSSHRVEPNIDAEF